MPAKHVVKEYIAGGTYHCMNHGIDNRTIFADDQDTQTFTHLLEYYLTLKPNVILSDARSCHSGDERSEDAGIIQDEGVVGASADIAAGKTSKRGRRARALANQIELLAFCLTPNHYHLLLRQQSPHALGTFMQCVCSTYAMYFNQRNKRRGPLYEGTYRAVLVQESKDIAAVIRHIHTHDALISSAGTYAGRDSFPWVTTVPLSPSPPDSQEATHPFLLDAHP